MESPPWIERVVGILGAIGFNKVRVRWKLQRWVNEREKARNRRANKVAHIEYEHRVCPECTAVNARDEQVCTRCGAKLSSRPVEMLGRLGLRGPVIQSMSTVISFAILAVYARTGIANHGAFNIGIPTLVAHGGNWYVLDDAEPWRYLTSVFLHAGLLHLAFNLIALAVVGPQVEEDYGRWPMLFLFIVTGVFAAVATRYMGMDGVGIGASGAVTGLIGVAAAAGHRAGTTRGKHRRNDMLKWAAYVMFVGFIVGADNRAHLAGFVLGGAIGLLVPPRVVVRNRTARVIGGILGGLAMVTMLGAVALTMVPHERYPMVPWMPDTGLLLFDQSSGDPGDLDDTGTAIYVCNQYRHGNAEIVEYFGGDGMIEELCTALDQWRLECVGKADPECDEIHRLGGLLAPGSSGNR